MNELDVAYMAGQLDADGCICVAKGRRKNDWYIVIDVNIVSQDIDLLNWMTETFNGRIMTMGTARAYKWVPRDWETFIKLVLPYLRTKKAQAELVLEYRDHTKAKGRVKRTPEHLAFQEYVFKANKELNAKLPKQFPKTAMRMR